MIHGIYVRTRPKHKWHLFSITWTAEAANKELENALQEATKGGNEQGEAAIQIFDTSLFIPEMLSEIKERKSLGVN